jgi:hypothetical protein
MKKLLLLLLIPFLGTAYGQIGTNAPWMEAVNDPTRVTEPTFQEIVNAFENYWVDKDPTIKGSGYKPFKRWESLYQDYLNEDGTVMSKEQLWNAWSAVNQTRSAESDESNWVSVGPLTHTNTGSWSSGQGRVNAFAVDPSNASAWYAGAPAGGIWASKDSGNTWEPLADELPQIGVSGIAIDPNNSDIIYIATGDDDNNDSAAVGVLKTTDGGSTWNFTDLNLENSPDRLSEIYIDPTDSQTVWVATSAGIFKTINGGDLWTNVRPGNFEDIKLKPGDNQTIYGATDSQFHVTIDGGTTWQTITNGFPGGFVRLVLDVTPANPDVVYIFASDPGFGSGKVFKSSDGGISFQETFNGGQNIFESPQAWFDMAFAVSDTNENEIYTGILNIWKSTNSGSSFSQVNQWNNPTGASYTHADIHRLNFIDGRLFCGSDGGLYTSTDSGVNFTDHTSGLAIGQFYRISQAKNNSARISGGLQDNGGYARNNEMWQNYYGADGMETATDPNNPDRIFGFIQNGGGLYISNSGGASLDASFNGPEGGNWITPLQFSKDDRLYAAYSRVYEFDFCSNSWQIKSPSFGQFIDRLITDPNDEDIMYVAINNQLYRSEDKGSSFDLLNSFGDFITGIEVNNGDSNLIYISLSGTNGDVFIGDLSSGSLELENITGSLPNIPKLVIKHQGRHSDNPLFLGTGIGVWRYDDVLGDWEPFENGLPNVPVRDLEIGLEDGKLTAATFGRGVWQTDIETQPIDTDLEITNLSTTTGQSVSCTELSALATVTNNGTSAVSTFDITYEAGGITNTITWNGNLAPGESTDLDLEALSLEFGTYNFEATLIQTSDQILANNDKSIEININKSGVPEEQNDFETSEDELLVLSGGDASIQCAESESVWQRGIPTGSVLGQAASGQNVYGTNLSGNHPDNVLEYLTTPCYDLSAIANPTISLNMAFELELDWDILYVEYSTDDSVSWNLLGSSDDENWYNSNTVPGGNCFNCPGAQWTGTISEYQQYSLNLDDLSSETNVVFRFVFHSDQNTNEEGVIIDDLRIGDGVLSTEDFTTSDFRIFPNPSKDLFNITWNTGEELTLSVFDITGKEVLKTNTLQNGQTEYNLDMSSYATGVYILQANSPSNQIIKKIILQ